MNLAFAAARDTASRTLRTTVVWVVGGYALLAALTLPAIADLALAAAPRAVTDLGLLGARLGALLVAVLAGHAVGSTLRQAEGAAPVGPALARVAAALVTSWAALGLLVVVWLAVAAFLQIGAPAGLAAWAVGAAAQGAIVVPLAACFAAWLGRIGGGAATLAVVMLAHLQGAWRAPPPDSVAGQAGRGLGWLVPDMSRLDHHAALVGASASTPGALLGDVLHAGLWTAAAVVALVVVVKLRARS